MGGDAVEVVGGQHDRQPVAVEVGKEVEDLVAGAEVDTRRSRRWRIWPKQRPGEEHVFLPSTAGQMADVPVGS